LAFREVYDRDIVRDEIGDIKPIPKRFAILCHHVSGNAQHEQQAQQAQGAQQTWLKQEGATNFHGWFSVRVRTATQRFRAQTGQRGSREELIDYNRKRRNVDGTSHAALNGGSANVKHTERQWGKQMSFRL
jgi:hypothetical protein